MLFSQIYFQRIGILWNKEDRTKVIRTLEATWYIVSCHDILIDF